MRQIVLDTETTGLEPAEGHRIIEIGCVELFNRRLTGKHFHVYINPEREVDEGALKVHGISNEFLRDKPVFTAILDEFITFVAGAELIIHNAAFDMGFLNHELKLAGSQYHPLETHCSVTDTLLLAREKHPRQKNNLDALCKRYQIDNSHRDLHGALLDAEILALVYLAMTGGQAEMFQLEQEASFFGSEKLSGGASAAKTADIASRIPIKILAASNKEEQAHAEFLKLINKRCGGPSVWETLSADDI